MAGGGVRVGAGRPRKNPREQAEAGNPTHKPLKIMNIPVGEELEGAPMPEVKSYMTEAQHGIALEAEDVFNETWAWLRRVKCAQFVSPQLVRSYAQSVGRWIQCEHAISQYGFIAQRKTTGEPIASPFVAMSQNYMKQVNNLWFQIYRVVQENTLEDFRGAVPQDDVMERLLRARGSK